MPRRPFLAVRSCRAVALGAALAVSAGALGAARAERAPAVAARPRQLYTIQQFMKTTQVMGASFSPDEERVLLSSNETGIFNAYTVPVTGGRAVPLTRSRRDTTHAVSFFPKDERILYMRDTGGNESSHLYVRERDGKERDLTPAAPDKPFKATFMGWSDDDQSFFVSTNERDPRFFDLYRYAAKDYTRSLLFENTEGLELSQVSSNGKWVALLKPNTMSDSDIFLYDLEKRQLKNMTAHEGQVQNVPSAFAPEGTALYFLSDEGREFTRVRRYVLASGAVEEAEQADWDVSYTSFSRRGKYRVTAVNADGRTAITVYDAKTGERVALPTLPAGNITSVTFSPSETKMAFYMEGDRSPSNLFVYDFKTGKTAQLTHSLPRELDPEDLVESEVVRFKSFDGVEVPNLLWKPHQASAEKKAPAVVVVHGGPGGQMGMGYVDFFQYLVNHGYVVLAVNYRGSSGYGKAFLAADDGKHGREPLWDCVEAKRYLQGLPYVDPERVGILGASYGGYMVLAALAFHPDVFSVGVDFYGMSNWLSTLENIPPQWESVRLALYQEIGDPKKDAERLRATSPIFHAERIKKPLLVFQGANDPRVPKSESDAIVEAVKKNGVPVKYVVFPDEGHGFKKRVNEEKAYQSTLKFLDQHLKAQARN